MIRCRCCNSVVHADEAAWCLDARHATARYTGNHIIMLLGQLPLNFLKSFTRAQALGLSPNANSEAVQRSYRRALNDAKGDKGRIEKIEAAHTRIMMSGLTQRMKVCKTSGVRRTRQQASHAHGAELSRPTACQADARLWWRRAAARAGARCPRRSSMQTARCTSPGVPGGYCGLQRCSECTSWRQAGQHAACRSAPTSC